MINQERDLLDGLDHELSLGMDDLVTPQDQAIALEEIERAGGDLELATVRIAARLAAQVDPDEVSRQRRIRAAKETLARRGYQPRDPNNPDGEWVAIAS
jgi:hypothetical protein